MKQIIHFFPIIFFFIIIVVFGYFLLKGENPSNIPSVFINKSAPKIIAESLNNEKFNFNNEFNKNNFFIVNFFASWCVPCAVEIKYLNSLSDLKDLKIIGINYKDDPSDTFQWLKQYGNNFIALSKYILD